MKTPEVHRASNDVSYPPIEAHGVVGDRRMAALVAADGTVDWLCLPDYDSPPVLGALIDAERGGMFRFGSLTPVIGDQRYLDGPCILATRWTDDGADLELTDAML